MHCRRVVVLLALHAVAECGVCRQGLVGLAENQRAWFLSRLRCLFPCTLYSQRWRARSLLSQLPPNSPEDDAVKLRPSA